MYSAPSSQGPGASSSSTWRDPDLVRTVQDIKRPLELHENFVDEEDDFYDEDPSEDGDDRFFNPALLSHIAVRLRDKVPRGTHVKGSIPYPRAFTGKDVVVRATHMIYAGHHSHLRSPRSSHKFNASFC